MLEIGHMFLQKEIIVQKTVLSVCRKKIKREERFKKPYAIVDVASINHHHLQRCDEAHQLLIDGKGVILFTPTEYRMLLLLLDHLGETLSFEELFAGPFEQERDRRTFTKHMTHLREKIACLGLTIVCCNDYGYLMRVAISSFDASQGKQHASDGRRYVPLPWRSV